MTTPVKHTAPDTDADTDDATCGQPSVDVLVPQGVDARPVAPRPEAGAALADIAALEDPLARAAAATRLLAALDAQRLEVVRVRRQAVAASTVSVRRLARALGVSVTAASDLRRAAAGGRRRLDRDAKKTAPRPADTATDGHVDRSFPQPSGQQPE